MQRELDAAALQFSDHRHHRRDADAAGQQQMPCRTLGERELLRGSVVSTVSPTRISSCNRREPSPSRNTAMQ